jgi:hypothetical protein
MSEFAHSQIESDVRQERLPQVVEDENLPERLDTVFDLLRSSRRRALLYYLCDAGTDLLPVETVVEEVREYEMTASRAMELPPRQTVRTSLVHAHLPRLAEFDVLDYDPRRGEVHVHGFDSLEPWLDQVRTVELE